MLDPRFITILLRAVEECIDFRTQEYKGFFARIWRFPDFGPEVQGFCLLRVFFAKLPVVVSVGINVGGSRNAPSRVQPRKGPPGEFHGGAWRAIASVGTNAGGSENAPGRVEPRHGPPWQFHGGPWCAMVSVGVNVVGSGNALGSVVPRKDNFYAALNSAVFSDGSFVYIPKGVRCPMELSTYFRINEANTGQFERTLIIADEGSHVSYLEGCTAPMRDENQLHAAVVELVALDDAEIKYSTVQNWYPGDAEGKGGIYNFVTKRGLAHTDAKISWTQVETGSAVTWKYPSCILRGDNSVGEFYSVALTNNLQQADTGTKMIHLGKNTRSTIISKGISAGKSSNAYRGLVRVGPTAKGARNYTQCDSLLIGDQCAAHTFPYIESKNPTGIIEHEATTSKVSDDQLYLCQQRGLDPEKAVSMIVNGFCKEVFKELPMEFAVEAGKLLEVSLEGSVG